MVAYKHLQRVSTPLEQLPLFNDLLQLPLRQPLLLCPFIQRNVHLLYHAHNALQSLLHDLALAGLSVSPRQHIGEHVCFHVLRHSLDRHFTQMSQSEVLVAEKDTLHLIVVMDVELEPTTLLEVHFHGIVLKFRGVEVFADDVARGKVHQVE